MEILDFKTAFKYPLNRPVGMLNILWLFVPIFGWFALWGYAAVIIRGFLKGEFRELPLLDFVPHMKLGFYLFVRYIPFMLAYGVVSAILGSFESSFIAFAQFIAELFLLPLVCVNFMYKGTVASSFEFSLVKVVFDDLGEYCIVLGKSFALGFIYLVMSIILIGIPAGAFTNSIFLADFYRRKIKNNAVGGSDDIEIIPIEEQVV